MSSVGQEPDFFLGVGSLLLDLNTLWRRVMKNQCSEKPVRYPKAI